MLIFLCNNPNYPLENIWLVILKIFTEFIILHLYMITLENWVFKSNFYLVSLEFSGSGDWKIELGVVVRYPRGWLMAKLAFSAHQIQLSNPQMRQKYKKGMLFRVLKEGAVVDFPRGMRSSFKLSCLKDSKTVQYAEGVFS